MATRTRYTALLGMATLAFSLAACDETPLSNSAEPADNMALQQGAGQATFGNLIAALNNINVQIERLSALNNLTVQDVQVVNVQDVLNNSLNQNEVLTNFLNRNQTDIEVLRVTLTDVLNRSLIDLVDIGIINITDVIAVNVLSGGDVVVFAQ